MAGTDNEKSRDRIRERIVPRNNFKRALTVTLSVLGLALVGGLVAGVMFKIGETLVGQNVETRIEQFIIARDTDAPEETTRAAVTESEPAETPKEGETAPSESAGPGVLPPTEPENPQAKTPDEIFREASQSVIEVIVEKNTGTDLFNTDIISRYSTVGAFIAESTESVYFLMDDSRHEENDTVVAVIGSGYYPAAFVQRDELTGLAVYKLSIEALNAAPPVLTLGNSFLVHTADTVCMFGMQTGRPLSFSQGHVTFVDGNEAAEDGYHQHIFTDIGCVPEASGILLNEDCEIVGWVSEHFRTDSGQADAGGISPLKYLIEDLCSGTDTAYMGVTCLQVSANQAQLLGVEAGLYVSAVKADSPAFSAGIQVGDRLVGIDERNLQSNSFFASRLDEYAPGDTAVIRLMRKSGGEYAPLELPLTFGSR